VLIIVGILCVLQAMKDYKTMEAEKAEKEKAEKEKRQQQFFYDKPTENTDEENE